MAFKSCGLGALCVSVLPCPGKCKVLGAKTRADSVLISVNLWETKLHNLIKNVVCILSFLKFGILSLNPVPDVDQGLVPIVEFPCLSYLPHPEVDYVKIVVIEDLLFIACFNFKVVKALLEIPFWFPHKFQHKNVFEVNDNMGLVGELWDCFVADQYALNRV